LQNSKFTHFLKKFLIFWSLPLHLSQSSPFWRSIINKFKLKWSGSFILSLKSNITTFIRWRIWKYGIWFRNWNDAKWKFRTFYVETEFSRSWKLHSSGMELRKMVQIPAYLTNSFGLQKCNFLIEIKFTKNHRKLKCLPKTSIFTQILIFDQNFYFWLKFEFRLLPNI